LKSGFNVTKLELASCTFCTIDLLSLENRISRVQLTMNLNVWILIFYSINSVLANITESIVNVDSYKFYENEDGTVDKQRTVLYLHFVNPEDNSIMEVDSVLSLIDKNHKFLNELYQEFHVLLGEVRISHFSYFNHSLNSLFL